jgi:hypothetical protein
MERTQSNERRSADPKGQQGNQEAELSLLASVGLRVANTEAYEENVIREATYESARVPNLGGSGFPDLSSLLPGAGAGPNADRYRRTAVAKNGRRGEGVSALHGDQQRTAQAVCNLIAQIQTNLTALEKNDPAGIESDSHKTNLLRMKLQMLLSLGNQSIIASSADTKVTIDKRWEISSERKRSVALKAQANRDDYYVKKGIHVRRDRDAGENDAGGGSGNGNDETSKSSGRTLQSGKQQQSYMRLRLSALTPSQRLDQAKLGHLSTVTEDDADADADWNEAAERIKRHKLLSSLDIARLRAERRKRREERHALKLRLDQEMASNIESRHEGSRRKSNNSDNLNLDSTEDKGDGVRDDGDRTSLEEDEAKATCTTTKSSAPAPSAAVTLEVTHHGNSIEDKGDGVRDAGDRTSLEEDEAKATCTTTKSSAPSPTAAVTLEVTHHGNSIEDKCDGVRDAGDRTSLEEDEAKATCTTTKSTAPAPSAAVALEVTHHGKLREPITQVVADAAIVCPICHKTLDESNRSLDAGTFLAIHIEQCQKGPRPPTRRRSTRAGRSNQKNNTDMEDGSQESATAANNNEKVESDEDHVADELVDVPEDRNSLTATMSKHRPKRKRKNVVRPSTSTSTSRSAKISRDDLELWEYEDRVDEWIEGGVANMRHMHEQDESESPPGEARFPGGLTIPAWMNNRLFPYQRSGVRWMWELHLQGCGGIVGDEMGLGESFFIFIPW